MYRYPQKYPQLILLLTQATMSILAVRDTPPPGYPLNCFLESHSTLYIGIFVNNSLISESQFYILQKAK